MVIVVSSANIVKCTWRNVVADHKNIIRTAKD